MGIQKWKPATEFAEELAPLPIYAPPCPDCKHWKPVRKYRGTQYDGVVLCHSDEMYADFSCFEAKPKPEPPEPEPTMLPELETQVDAGETEIPF